MTMNSTISELVQDNSNITTETNPIATVQNSDLVFGQKHNDIDCALCPTAQRACDRAWVTAKQIENWSGMTKGTLRNRLIELEECERISRGQDFNHVDIPTETGAVKTTIYNLNVLNQLAMVEMKNKVLNDTAKKFSDILSEVETTGSYSIRKPDSYMIEDKIERAKRWIEETEAWQKALSAEETAHAETKVLLAEEKEKSEYLERSKSWIGDKKVASAMGTAGALSKKCDRLEKELDKVKSEMDSHIRTACDTIRKEFEDAWMTARDWCFKHKLPVYANEPKWTVSNSLAGICMAYPDREPWHMNAYGVRMFPKWACDILDKVYDDDDTFLSEYRAD